MATPDRRQPFTAPAPSAHGRRPSRPPTAARFVDGYDEPIIDDIQIDPLDDRGCRGASRRA